MDDQLTFAALERCVEAEIHDDPVFDDFGVPAWGWRLAFIGTFMAIAIGFGWRWANLSPRVALILIGIGFSAEVIGLLVCIVPPLVRGARNLRNARRRFADDLDHAASEIGKVVAWLRRFPPEERERMLGFVEGMRDGITYRMGFILGGFEKLGFLPILLALYFQFREIESVGWSALTNMNLAAGVCLFLLVVLYGAGLLIVRHKLQLNGYARFLAFSLAPDKQ